MTRRFLRPLRHKVYSCHDKVSFDLNKIILSLSTITHLLVAKDSVVRSGDTSILGSFLFHQGARPDWINLLRGIVDSE